MAGAKAKRKVCWVFAVFLCCAKFLLFLFFNEQKWNKGKLREKIQAKILFDEDSWTRLQAEVPKMKLVTPSALVERLKINCSLARAACKYLAEVCAFCNHVDIILCPVISYLPLLLSCRRARSLPWRRITLRRFTRGTLAHEIVRPAMLSVN